MYPPLQVSFEVGPSPQALHPAGQRFDVAAGDWPQTFHIPPSAPVRCRNPRQDSAFPLLVATSRTQTRSRSHSVCRGYSLPYSYHVNTAAAETKPPAEQWLSTAARRPPNWVQSVRFGCCWWLSSSRGSRGGTAGRWPAQHPASAQFISGQHDLCVCASTKCVKNTSAPCASGFLVVLFVCLSEGGWLSAGADAWAAAATDGGPPILPGHQVRMCNRISRVLPAGAQSCGRGLNHLWMPEGRC